MATFIMLPDGVTGTNNWKNWCPNPNPNFCGAADHTLVDDDTAINSYIHETLNNQVVTFTMANPSVVEGDIDTINSVTVKIKAQYDQSSVTKDLKVEQTGGSISNGSDTHTLDDSAFPLYTGTAEQYSTGTTAWEYSDLEDLQVKLTTIDRANRFYYYKVSYIYAEVDYVAAAAGYTNDVIGIDSGDISKINGIATANISKVNSV